MISFSVKWIVVPFLVMMGVTVAVSLYLFIVGNAIEASILVLCGCFFSLGMALVVLVLERLGIVY